MAIDRVHDKRVKEARANLISTRSAYKQARIERDELIQLMHYKESSSADYLGEQFQMQPEAIQSVLDRPYKK